ncbi:hypothetical protein BJY16_006026 [Actinoplanes octamycinicus]|uniref:Uncharacterized protein n=1 Tax=Actinoplanes octamycinicus TaxID=135948 RepID=A0A7W7H2N8_9ACTN|nr:hypothetical protein [Actinoplanes octamycinicus]MBB4742567.1 hypothetical protein [Actinoplanes octamycinicus]GIE60905.1 hypothetical protein Aoc01nite_63070 [Actinoplanes octamycinicus]
MSDHWDGFDHHDDDGLADFADSHELPETHELPDLPEQHDLPEHHDVPDWEHHDPEPLDVPHSLDDIPEMSETDFPPALDVGDLPEPVDGFPWVDATSLGTPDTYTAPAEPVDPHQLAAYAGIEVPDGADPWATLAASDDPAVSALARWWTPDEQ